MKEVVVLLGLMALISGCLGQSASETALVNVMTEVGQVTVTAEVADSFAERSIGLMGREMLGENKGMLFVFEDEAVRSFWMKDTLISLDILFIDRDRKIVDIQRMEPCEADPCPTYRSAAPAKWALEVNAGFVATNGIKVGDRVAIVGL